MDDEGFAEWLKGENLAELVPLFLDTPDVECVEGQYSNMFELKKDVPYQIELAQSTKEKLFDFIFISEDGKYFSGIGGTSN